MDFANRGNRPSQSPQQNEAPSNEQPKMAFQPPVNKTDRGSKATKAGQILMLVIISALALALVLALIFSGGKESYSENDLIEQDKYQAVFLNSQDGQVYFGKLDVYNDDLYYLSDIYYVRVENPVQPEGANQQQQQQANISLAKLGKELHGPEDAMYISRDKVLYWENLTEEGQVVTAIKDFKANGEKTNDTNNQQQQQQQEPAAAPKPSANDTPTAP